MNSWLGQAAPCMGSRLRLVETASTRIGPHLPSF
jgi:hypothetical protein